MTIGLHRTTVAALTAALALTFTAAPAWADKPEWAGQGHGEGKHKDKDKKHAKGKDRDGARGHRPDRRDPRVGGYFNDDDRRAVRVYYGEHYGRGKGCPPGLAKKHNGCLPPGQAKKLYAVGQPLPPAVVIYPVPQPVLVQLPPAPAGHKYVRVAADILLIAVGTSMVVDAMQDLARI